MTTLTSLSTPTSRRASPLAIIAAEAELPTRHGHFRIAGFSGLVDGRDHVALVRGEVAGHDDVLVRIHSECFTGDVAGSLRCDCREQLERAQQELGARERGVILYLRQEGRGIGLVNKIRAYALQERGLDTVDANLALGFRDDERDYEVAAQMLRALGVRSIRLMTNNPTKVNRLEAAGIKVTERVPHEIAPGEHNRGYLLTKAQRSGHALPGVTGSSRRAA